MFNTRRPSLFFYVVSIVMAAILGGVVSLAVASNMGFIGLGKPNQSNQNPISSLPNLDIPQGGDSKTSGPIVAISEQVGPAVVGISNMVNSSDFFRGTELVEQGTGSGVIFDSQGYIVTNNHVVEGAEQLMVSLYDGRQVKAKLIGRDVRTDLAVVKIDAPNLTAAKFGNSDNLKVGETAVAIGNPGGAEFARSVTQGIISGLNRLLITNEGLQFKLIQTDAAINPGNSGGALVNVKGELVGINTIKIARSGFEGMGFAIPINMAREIIKELVDKGKVTRPALGVEMVKDVDPQLAQYYDLGAEYGVLVRPVQGGPAAQAGIKTYDIIIALDGKTVKTRYDLQNILFEKKVGDTIKISLVRDKKRIEVQVKLSQLTQ